VLLVLLLLPAIEIFSQTVKPELFSLEDAIQYALTHNPLLEKLNIDAQQVKLLQDEVRAATILPKFELTGEFGVVPEARGDIFQSPDKQTDLDDWGPFYKVKLEMLQPILTFGRRSSAMTAARSALDLQYIKNDSEREELLLNVINAFWAVWAAKNAKDVANEVQENYDKLEKEVKKRLQSEESEVDDTDLLEIQSNRYQIEEIVIKSQTESETAEKLLNLTLGRDITSPIQVSEPLVPKLLLVEDRLQQIIGENLSKHRDIQGLQTAVKALKAKSELAYSKKRPLVYIVGGFAYAYAPCRDDQTNPFAVDNFNYTDMGAFAGFQWDLNSFRKNTEARRYQLEKESMEQNLVLLRSKIHMEIAKAFAEVNQNVQLLEQATASLKSAKNWLRLSMDNWEIGLGKVERLIKAYNAYFLLKGVEIKRQFQLNTSIANFAYLLGNIHLYLEWIKNGHIQL